MAVKNNDDVAHLLDATGRSGTTYREFESSSEQMSAPLIDAIFGKEPPPAQEEKPFAVGATSGNDLLADVFDRAPGFGAARPVERGGGGWASEPPRSQPVTGIRASAPMAGGPVRSLSDIRRIISQPVDQAAAPPSSGSLNGLFDRLAR